MLFIISLFQVWHTCLHLWRLSRLSSPTISNISMRISSGNRSPLIFCEADIFRNSLKLACIFFDILFPTEIQLVLSSYLLKCKCQLLNTISTRGTIFIQEKMLWSKESLDLGYDIFLIYDLWFDI